MDGTEAMYNITEKKLREIERIEENQIKNTFKTETGIQVTLHIMYLDGRQLPARFQIKRYKLNFMQYILQQGEESLLYQVLEAQTNQPTKGDWYSECSNILEHFTLNIGLEEVKSMTRQQFKKLTKESQKNKHIWS